MQLNTFARFIRFLGVAVRFNIYGCELFYDLCLSAWVCEWGVMEENGTKISPCCALWHHLHTVSGPWWLGTLHYTPPNQHTSASAETYWIGLLMLYCPHYWPLFSMMSVEAGLRSGCVCWLWLGRETLHNWGEYCLSTRSRCRECRGRPAPPAHWVSAASYLTIVHSPPGTASTAPPPRQLPARHSTRSFTSWNPFITTPAGQSLALRSWRTAAATSLNSQFADALQHSDGGL